MTSEMWLLATQWTARIGLPLFLGFYVTRAVRPWLWAFAFTHSVHLVALTGYLTVSDATRPASVVLVGGAGYVAIYLLAFAPQIIARAQPWATAFVLVLFANSYVSRLFEPDRRWVGVYGTGLIVAAIAIRWARRDPLVRGSASVVRALRRSRSSSAPRFRTANNGTES